MFRSAPPVAPGRRPAPRARSGRGLARLRLALAAPELEAAARALPRPVAPLHLARRTASSVRSSGRTYRGRSATIGAAIWRRSSAGQSVGLITRRSVVRAHPPLLPASRQPVSRVPLHFRGPRAVRQPAPSVLSLNHFPTRSRRLGKDRSQSCDHARLHRVQAAQLPDEQIEAEHARPGRVLEVLPLVRQAHAS